MATYKLTQKQQDMLNKANEKATAASQVLVDAQERLNDIAQLIFDAHGITDEQMSEVKLNTETWELEVPDEPEKKPKKSAGPKEEKGSF